jgi:potassium uptake TrkH family protein
MPPIDTINRIRESINLRLYPHKNVVLSVFKILSFFVSLIAIGSVIYYHGYPRAMATDEWVYIITRGSLAFYVLKYFVGFFYDFHPLQYIKRTWFEGVLVVLVALLGAFSMAFGVGKVFNFFVNIGLPDLPALYIIFVQLYVFIMVVVELGKASSHISKIKLGPAGMLVVSFLILIFSGAGLLMLPEMTITKDIRFINALFTSTSACCVTGLTVVDTATCFSTKGQFIVMLLIQLGGINIISFAAFFATFYGSSSGLKQQSLLKDLLSTHGLSDTRMILRRVVFFSIAFEFVGALGLFITWYDYLPVGDFRDKIFYAVFHSVSAFNNAGFALFTTNLMDSSISQVYSSHWIIMILIFFGGLGFSAIQDIFGAKSIRQRIKNPWKKLHVQTKIVLHTSLALVLVGAVVFYLLERNNTLKDMGVLEWITASFFQSVTTRTAGFNSVDFSRLGQPVLLFIIVLMYIGASPGSTGGGIKTTTFLALFKSATATIRGKKNIEVFKHTLSFETVDKAYTVALFSFVLIIISTFFLSITETNFSFLSLLFEEVSAFGTVGLSTGITPFLSDAGKTIIVLTMFVGRIGTLTLAVALTRKVAYTKYTYPHAEVMIG